MRFRCVPFGAGGFAGDRRADRRADAAPPPAEAALTVDQVLDNMEAVRKKIKTFKADVVKLRQATAWTTPISPARSSSSRRAC